MGVDFLFFSMPINSYHSVQPYSSMLGGWRNSKVVEGGWCASITIVVD
jgi:hypothetical protein